MTRVKPGIGVPELAGQLAGGGGPAAVAHHHVDGVAGPDVAARPRRPARSPPGRPARRLSGSQNRHLVRQRNANSLVLPHFSPQPNLTTVSG